MTDDRFGSPDALGRPVIRDKRRIDPETFEPRRPQDAGAGADSKENPLTDNSEFVPDGEAGGDGAEASLIPDDASELLDAESPLDTPVEASAAQRATAGASGDFEALAAERTADLQRLQAEYANYKRRVDRDRGLARAGGIEAVALDLLPVFDSIEAAREHGELTGGFKLVADELEKIGTKHGLETFGEVGDTFDPNIHEALMHMPYDGPHDEVVVSAVMQKGVKLNDRVIRPARVGVADPE